MKSIANNRTLILKYPLLMISERNSAIVLMTAYGVGTCVNSGALSNQMGQYAEGWDMDAFIPFQGTVTLSND